MTESCFRPLPPVRSDGHAGPPLPTGGRWPSAPSMSCGDERRQLPSLVSSRCPAGTEQGCRPTQPLRPGHRHPGHHHQQEDGSAGAPDPARPADVPDQRVQTRKHRVARASAIQGRHGFPGRREGRNLGRSKLQLPYHTPHHPEVDVTVSLRILLAWPEFVAGIRSRHSVRRADLSPNADQPLPPSLHDDQPPIAS
jgi:hypothetical protein